MASSQTSLSSEGSSRGEEQPLLPSHDQGGPQPLPDVVLYQKIDELVDFLIHKYRKKQLTSRAEMVHCVIQRYPEHFPRIFNRVCDCLYVVFGIDVKEVDPPGYIYVLAPALGLTYNERVADEYCIAKTGLLIMIITAIFRRGNSASEEVIWQALSKMQVFDGVEHFIYGEPRKYITEDLVQEGYVVYRQVPDSSPARYEFLWGPRTYAETTKMKVLEHLARVNKRDPWSYPLLYEEAFKEELEEARARRALRADGRASCRPGRDSTEKPHP
ncbi:melanoma-associated antigen 10-like [Cavia porcellus]|uniref:melanoma-associated antigen 10-like n=1 Tax=Cavia porcellus TaxID=10141 RepID=UPI00022B2A0C